MKEEFYLTLLSNSSMKYFPNNTSTNFITKLPKSLKLIGDWQVAVVEFQHPCTIFSVQESENYVRIIHRKTVYIDDRDDGFYDETIEVKIPPSNYDSIQDVIELLNTHKLLSNKIKFDYQKESNYVIFVNLSKDILRVEIAPKLCRQLGFSPHDNILKKPIGVHKASIYLGLPPQIFLYCDIVDPQIVGDVMAPLLRVVSLDSSKYVFGVNRMVTFSHLNYIPVMKREFDTIEIDIRSDTGYIIPFEFGTTCVKLHFRRIHE